LTSRIWVAASGFMAIAYISLGSNLGDRKKYCQIAIEKIKALPNIRVIKKSKLIETEPIGKTDQSKFINGVIKIQTKLKPYELLKALQKIENDLGRVRDEKWGPRTIDLDILYYDDLVVQDKELLIPHPEIKNRKFLKDALEQLGVYF